MVENPLMAKGVRRAAALTTTRALVTSVWSADVTVLDAALRRCRASTRSTGGCDVRFFEVEGDPHLHVNVTHLHSPSEVIGSTRAAAPPDGYVQSRVFPRAPRYQILRQIREMVFR